MIWIPSKVIVTRIKEAFFDSIDKNLEFNSARQVPPWDKKISVKSCFILIGTTTNLKKMISACQTLTIDDLRNFRFDFTSFYLYVFGLYLIITPNFNFFPPRNRSNFGIFSTLKGYNFPTKIVENLKIIFL